MLNKVTNVGVVLLASALISSGALAHTGKYIASGLGGKVVDGSGKCVTVASGTDIEACDPPKPAPKPEPKPAPKPVAKPTPKPAPAPAPQIKTINLAGDATFASNSAELTDNGKASLDNLLNDLQGLTLRSMTLIGHADSRGNDAYNQALSERRAKSVRSYLGSKGVDTTNIIAIGRGETDPVASNNTAEGRAKNRRVEIRLVATQPL